ncbi:hypothetical protein ACSFXN_02445 [Planococcus sp. 1R117A]|uniref:hypothetical protein n=1 Tax=Planococcus sp. 1R117A TaxID=3447020 RepID=UPI003EDC17C8
MGKDDFSTERQPNSNGTEDRRQREEFETIEQESNEDGMEMGKKGAHSNLGIGDEQNPIKEREEG